MQIFFSYCKKKSYQNFLHSVSDAHKLDTEVICYSPEVIY